MLPFTRGQPNRGNTGNCCGRYRLSSLMAFFLSADGSSRAMLSERVVGRQPQAKTFAKRLQTKEPKPKKAKFRKMAGPRRRTYLCVPAGSLRFTPLCRQVPFATRGRARAPPTRPERQPTTKATLQTPQATRKTRMVGTILFSNDVSTVGALLKTAKTQSRGPTKALQRKDEAPLAAHIGFALHAGILLLTSHPATKLCRAERARSLVRATPFLHNANAILFLKRRNTQAKSRSPTVLP